VEVVVQQPEGTGYCNRWGYKPKVLTEDNARAVRYQVVKK